MIFYVTTQEGVESVTSAALRELFTRVRALDARIINVSDTLSKLGNAGHLEAVPGSRPIAWKITDSGEERVREELELPHDGTEMRKEIADLTTLANKIASEETRDFLLEAVSCLSANALRAAVVFVWSGAIWTVQEWLFKNHSLKTIDAEIAKKQKTRDIKTIDDFAFVHDATTLYVARDLGLWDKGQHQMVEHALDLRNQSGHPSRYKVSPARCKSVIEELVTLVFTHAV